MRHRSPVLAPLLAALTVLATLATLALGVPASAATSIPLPSSMASAGDSITRGFDSTASGCFLTDCPQYSWSTGTSSSVDSHYQRILVAEPGIRGNAFNDAKTARR